MKRQRGPLAIVDMSDPYIQALLRPIQEELEIKPQEVDELSYYEQLSMRDLDEIVVAWDRNNTYSLREEA